MKTLLNLQFTIPVAIDPAGSSRPGSTASILALTLNAPPQGGFDFAAMRARKRVADAIEKVAPGDEISLEDADFQTAKSCVENYRWGGNHPDLIKFAEQFGL